MELECSGTHPKRLELLAELLVRVLQGRLDWYLLGGERLNLHLLEAALNLLGARQVNSQSNNSSSCRKKITSKTRMPEVVSSATSPHLQRVVSLHQ